MRLALALGVKLTLFVYTSSSSITFFKSAVVPLSSIFSFGLVFYVYWRVNKHPKVTNQYRELNIG